MKSYRVLALVASCFAVVASVSSGVRADEVAVAAAAVVPSAPSVSSRLTHRMRPQDAADATEPSVENTAQQAQAAMSAYIIEVVNALPDGTWTAGVNEYFQDKSFEFLKKSCGLKMDMQLSGSQAPNTFQNLQPVPIPGPNSNSPYIPPPPPQQPSPYLPQQPQQPQQPYVTPVPYTPQPLNPIVADIPLSFDARRAWGANCPSLFDIRDQAGCGSCWAVAAAEVMTDRHCIHSAGRNRPYLSAKNILSCCGSQCGSCEGGLPLPAFQFWQNSGVVTGGDFGTSDSCQPYYLAPCAHHIKGSMLPECVAQTNTPQCSETCTHGQSYHADKHFGASAYALPSSVQAIQRELLQNGPIEVGFMVYADFPHYKSGVYSHVQGDMVGGHAVKLMGWGVENGIDYWLCANSWNTNWGDAGFFKIRRGTNEGNIENMAWAGMPRVA